MNHKGGKGADSLIGQGGQNTLTEKGEMVAWYCYVDEQQKNKEFAVPSEIIEQPNKVKG